MMLKIFKYLNALILALSLVSTGSSRAERIKDMAQFEGVRTNQLIGYGLVLGLPGSGG